ncbi:MAG: hypothetical protein KAS74_08365, partial [Methanosarcinales archaeon]|nr:hypothetical protein [Methanosarcinales archaeon]
MAAVMLCGMGMVGAASMDAPFSSGEMPPATLMSDCGTNNPEMTYPHGIPITYADIGTDAAGHLVGSKISIRYSDADLDGLDEAGLTLEYCYRGEWKPLDATIDPASNTATAIAPTAPTSALALVYNGTSVNTDRSIYRPGEVARIIIVVLNHAGEPVCNSAIEMTVEAPDGAYRYSTADQTIVPTDRDGVYEAYHETTVEGLYNISCTAVIDRESSYFSTYFMVQSGCDFEIIRNAESVIDPTIHDRFDVGIDIISHTSASEVTIWEYIPSSFTVFTDADVIDAGSIKILTWQRNLTCNRTSVSYSYAV